MHNNCLLSVCWNWSTGHLWNCVKILARWKVAKLINDYKHNVDKQLQIHIAFTSCSVGLLVFHVFLFFVVSVNDYGEYVMVLFT